MRNPFRRKKGRRNNNVSENGFRVSHVKVDPCTELYASRHPLDEPELFDVGIIATRRTPQGVVTAECHRAPEQPPHITLEMVIGGRQYLGFHDVSPPVPKRNISRTMNEFADLCRKTAEGWR